MAEEAAEVSTDIDGEKTAVPEGSVINQPEHVTVIEPPAPKVGFLSNILSSATRTGMLLLILFLGVSLFAPVNDAVLDIFENALMIVLGAFFGAKGNSDSEVGDQLKGK